MFLLIVKMWLVPCTFLKKSNFAKKFSWHLFYSRLVYFSHHEVHISQFFLDKVLVSALSWEISIDLSFLNKAINKIHAECTLCVWVSVIGWRHFFLLSRTSTYCSIVSPSFFQYFAAFIFWLSADCFEIIASEGQAKLRCEKIFNGPWNMFIMDDAFQIESRPSS